MVVWDLMVTSGVLGPEVVCTVRLLFYYLLDFPIAIHSRVFVFDLAGDIDFEKPKS
jgi:hypothetical protein